MKHKKQNTKINRRAFLNTLGASAGIAASLPAISILSEATAAYADDIGPQGGRDRAESSEKIRQDVAERESFVRIPDHDDNGDEALYPSKIGNYSKNLKHDPLTGEVDPAAYQAMIAAISTGRFADFEALFTNGHFGASDPTMQRRLVNPGSGYAFDLEGTDSHQLKLAPAPAFASAQEAGEMAELYWMALLRDVNFADYDSSELAQDAAEDLSKLSDFRGPKEGGAVTTKTLFRDTYPGCTVGPYISQFLLQPCNFGAMRIDSRMVTVGPVDYMTDFQSWLDVQNGMDTPPIPTWVMAYCRSGRDLTHYVNIDQLFEAYFVSCINLLSNGYFANPGNPYGRIYDGGAGRPSRCGARSERIAGAGRLRNLRRTRGLDAGVRTGHAGIEGRLVSEVACPSALASRGIWRARRGEPAKNTRLSDPFRSAKRVDGARLRVQQVRNELAAHGVPRRIAESHFLWLGPCDRCRRVRDDVEGAVRRHAVDQESGRAESGEQREDVDPVRRAARVNRR